MRRLLARVIVCAAAALLAAGCGGDDSAEETTAAPAAPAPFEAESALIALEDLPPGWTQEPAEDDEDDEDEFCGEEAIVDPLDEAEAEFAEGGSLPVLAEAVGVFTPADAEAAMRALRRIADDCDTFTDEGTTYTVARSSFPPIGDDSVPLLVTARTEGLEIGLYVIAIRVGDGIALVGYGGLEPDVAEAERFARLAAEKLEQAQG